MTKPSVNSTTMRAAVLHGPSDLRVQNVSRPVAAVGEALVKIRANGICGSDLHFFESGRLGPFTVDRPYIPGHEAVGEVVSVGAEVDHLRVGQRVVIEPGVPCRRCDYCKRGLYNLCREVVFLSAPPVNGTLGEYVSHASDFLFPVPDEIDDEAAALVEPVSVGIHACNRAGLTPGARVAIIGSGPIGLITLLVARAYGAGKCIAVDLHQHRLNTAVELGAHSAVRAGDDEETVRSIIEETGGEGAAFVFDATGSSVGCSLAARVAAPAGIVTIIGWPEAHEFVYPIEIVIERELDVRGINRYRNTYPTALSLMQSRMIDVRPLISHRYPFDRVVDAFEFASTHRSEALKVVVMNG